MADKTYPEKVTKEKLVKVLRDLEPGTILVIDLPESRGTAEYAVSIQEGGGRDAPGI